MSPTLTLEEEKEKPSGEPERVSQKCIRPYETVCDPPQAKDQDDGRENKILRFRICIKKA